MLVLANNSLYIGLGVPLVIVIIVLFWAIGCYNKLVSMRNQCKNGFSQIDIQLKRRYDLIPNLVEVAKGYMQHERETLEAVISARNTAESLRKNIDVDNPSNMKALLVAESTLGDSLGGMFGLAEAYPDLKANQNMQQLTEELTTTENRISFSRQAYNDAVTFYNDKREQFPSNIIANFFSFRESALFEVDNEEEKKNITVAF